MTAGRHDEALGRGDRALRVVSTPVVPPLALRVTLGSLPDGTVNTPYTSTTVTTVGGRGTKAFSATGLPSGLVIHSSTGVVSGEPDGAAGTATVVVTVTDDLGIATRTYAVDIAAETGTLRVTTTSLPDATIGTPYSKQLFGAGGVPPYTFTATGLGNGLSIPPSPGHTISGTPQAPAGTRAVTVTIEDSEGTTATRDFDLVVEAATATPISITTTSLPDATIGVAYNQSIVTAGGAGTKTWGATGLTGTGLSINASGHIVGTPNGPIETLETTVTVGDDSGEDSQDLTIDVVAQSSNVPPVYVPNRTWVGIGGQQAYNAADYWRQYAESEGGPLQIVRLQVAWGAVNNGPNESNWHWSTIDTKVDDALALGLEVLMLCTYSAPWLTGQQFAVPGNTTWANWKVRFADFVQRAVARYRPRGVKFYEIYNEPNHVFWQPAPTNGLRYGELMQQVYNAAKDVSATAYVGTGGTAPVGGRCKSYLFVEDILDQAAADNYQKHPRGWGRVPFDFVCHHPYNYGRPDGAANEETNYFSIAMNHPNNAFAFDLPEIHNRMVAKVPALATCLIWGTELGCSHRTDAQTGLGMRNGMTDQDRKIASESEAYDHLRLGNRWWRGFFGAAAWPEGGLLPEWNVGAPKLGPWMLFESRDHGINLYSTAPYDPDQNYGLHRENGTAKTVAGNDAVDAYMELV